MKPGYVWAVAGMLALPVCGFAQQGEQSAEQIEIDATRPFAEEACFIVREVRDFDPMSDGFIFLEGRRDENYLLTMFPGCIGLRGARGIGISSAMSRVCSNSGAEVRYRGLGQSQTCPIVAVEAVESKADAEALVEQRSRAQERERQ
jgi:hypothetical protein